MNFSAGIKAIKVWFDEYNLWVLLADGRQIAVPLSFFPRLMHATPEQRLNYVISGEGIGLHWDVLDEDISVAGLILGYGDTRQSLMDAV